MNYTFEDFNRKDIAGIDVKIFVEGDDEQWVGEATVTRKTGPRGQWEMVFFEISRPTPPSDWPFEREIPRRPDFLDAGLALANHCVALAAADGCKLIPVADCLNDDFEIWRVIDPAALKAVLTADDAHEIVQEAHGEIGEGTDRLAEQVAALSRHN